MEKKQSQNNRDIFYESTHTHTQRVNKGNNKIIKLRAILQRESQNS
jgi:hypothetical protein